MIKLAARTFDLYTDSDMSIAQKIAHKLGNCKVATIDEVEALDDNAFALVMKTAGGALRRRLPVHDADATKLSAAYWEEVKSDLPKELVAVVDMKLAAAQQHHGIKDHGLSPDVFLKVAYIDAETLRPERKKVATAQVWGLTVDGKNYFPLHDEVLVKTAMDKFATTALDLEPHERFEYARAISKRAAELRLEVANHSKIANYTNNELNVDALAVALDDRKRIMKAAGLNTDVLDNLFLHAGGLPDKGMMEADSSWSEKCTKLAAIPRWPVERVIATLQGVDKLAGFNTEAYNRGLPDPFASCLKYSEAQPLTMVEGVDLAKIPPHRLAEQFDPEFLKEFSANPVQVYGSLPDPIKVMVRSLAEEGMKAEEPAVGSPATGNPQDTLNPAFTSGITV
jgi:hypothetical protein